MSSVVPMRATSCIENDFAAKLSNEPDITISRHHAKTTESRLVGSHSVLSMRCHVVLAASQTINITNNHISTSKCVQGNWQLSRDGQMSLQRCSICISWVQISLVNGCRKSGMKSSFWRPFMPARPVPTPSRST